MATQVLMPQLGEAVEEATITKWLKTEGDKVEEYEPLVEINTDKVDTELPSPATGTLLKIVRPEEGVAVEVGMILAWIGEPGESIPDGNSISEKDVQEAIITASSKVYPISTTVVESELDLGATQNLGFISPVVAKIAAEHGVDLRNITGSGLKGRITKKDIIDYINAQPRGLLSEGQTKTTQIPQSTDKISLIPHTPIRRRIAEHMLMSKQKSPHVTTVFEADMSKVIAHRAVNKEIFAQNDARLTFTAYFIAATAVALRAFPKVNSSWTDDGMLMHGSINIGMATSLGEEGLIVPVIKNADLLSLLGITRSVNDLANRARSNQLQPDDVSGGTFTITNHGVSGSLFAMPIINQPQSAILGVGKLQKRVIVLEDNLGYDTIAVRPMVYLTLTFDHRVLDGAIADHFLTEVVNTLENWT